ncbi:MAG: cell division protein ZapA [Polyangiaceae bacterium]
MDQRAERIPVELQVGGQKYRVLASAGDDTLLRLAALVDSKLREHAGPHLNSPQGLLLAAMALAHDLEEERAKRQQVERRSREVLKSVLTRVDSALGTLEASPSTDATEEPALVEVRRKGVDRAGEVGRDD